MPIRITESLMFNQLQNNILTSTYNMNTVEQELATGQKINQPSDDPAGTSTALSIDAVLNNISQYQTNANTAQTFLQMSDSQLNSVQGLLQQARTIAVSAANGGTQSQDTEEANAAQIGTIITEISNLANSQLGSRYIFAGTSTETAPFNASQTYTGNDSPIVATIGMNQTVQMNTPGDTVFSPIFAALQTLQTDITNGNASNISNNDLPAIDAANNGIDQSRAVIGSTLDQISNVVTGLGTSQGNYQNDLSNVQDVNIATAYTQLQQTQNIYQASLSVTASAFKYTLADFLQ